MLAFLLLCVCFLFWVCVLRFWMRFGRKGFCYRQRERIIVQCEKAALKKKRPIILRVYCIIFFSLEFLNIYS